MDLLLSRPEYQEICREYQTDGKLIPGDYFIHACALASIPQATRGLPFFTYDYVGVVGANFLEEIDLYLKDQFALIAKDIRVTNFREGKECKRRALYSSETTILYMSFNFAEEDNSAAITLNSMSLDEKVCLSFSQIMSASHHGIQVEKTLSILCKSDCGLYEKDMRFQSDPLIRDNYSDEVVKKYEDLLKVLPSKDPTGRLVILEGPAGTGKTYLIKSLLAETAGCKFLVLPPNLVSEIDQPTLLTHFLSHREEGKPYVLLLEDADSCLSARKADNMSGISSLLNLTDGLIGSLLDIRIIASTNADKLDIDPALMRKGRLLSYLSIGELSLDHARRVYTRLVSKDLPSDQEPKTLAEVYALAFGEAEESGELTSQSSSKKKPAGFFRRD